MRSFKTVILLLVAVVVFGSAGYYGYQLFLKPMRLDHLEKKAAANGPAALPTPDPGLAGFEQASALQNSGKLLEARDAWRVWLEAHPESPKADEAAALLGKANMEILFSPNPGPEKETYTVVKGDSLARIASRQKSNAELIFRINTLPNINLQIGQQLQIAHPLITLELDRGKHRLTLLDNGLFLKSYTLLSAPPSGKTPTTLETKVIDKIAMSGNKRIAFGDKKYAESEQTILLGTGGNISGAPAPPTDGSTPPPLPPGYVLSTTDLQEIFPLVGRDTKATIH